MDLLVIGINHRTAPLEVREKLWLSAEEVRSALPQLRQQWFSECFVVSTCNRTEIYGIPASVNGGSPSLDSVGQFLIDLKAAGATVKLQHLYRLAAADAIRHLFRVAAGVDSMVVGDVQILGQVREGFALGLEQKTVGIFLNRLLQSTNRVGKRVRSETRIGEGAVSVSYAAVELASKIFEDLTQRSALLIGAGETGELAARHLQGKNIGGLFIANRTRAKAEEVAAALGAHAVDFDSIREKIQEVDIVVSCIGGSGYVLTRDEITDAMKKRLNRPLLVLDLGVPRNVDPSANKIGNVFLHDLDALAGIVRQNIEQRETEVPKAIAIVDEELGKFHAWYSSLEVHPTITDLHRHFEEIRQDEVQKHQNRFSSANDRELLDLVTRRIVNKILHAPTTELRNGSNESDEMKRKRIHIVRTLFGLRKDDPDS